MQYNVKITLEDFELQIGKYYPGYFIHIKDNKMKFEDLKSVNLVNFIDISSEMYRVYEFSGNRVEIDMPVALHISDRGSHRILDAKGVSHYIPTGWIHLYWEAYDGQPHFVT